MHLPTFTLHCNATCKVINLHASLSSTIDNYRYEGSEILKREKRKHLMPDSEFLLTVKRLISVKLESSRQLIGIWRSSGKLQYSLVPVTSQPKTRSSYCTTSSKFTAMQAEQLHDRHGNDVHSSGRCHCQMNQHRYVTFDNTRTFQLAVIPPCFSNATTSCPNTSFVTNDIFR